MPTILQLGQRYRLFRRIRNNDKKLREVSLVDGHIGPSATKTLSGALQVNSSVTTLWLSGNDFGDAGAVALADTFRKNHTIRHCIMGVNAVGPEGAKAQARALTDEKVTLEVLCMGSNHIGDEGACAIAESLVSNRSLKELWLRDNKFGKKGAVTLASALQKNSTLKELWIGGNLVGNDGASAFADVLRCNNSALSVLDLSNNSIGTIGAFALADALRTNHRIIKLDLEGNPIKDADLLDEINYLLENNKMAGGKSAEVLKATDSGFDSAQVINETPLTAIVA